MIFPKVQDCPLCFATASYAELLHGDKRFLCPNCIEFRIGSISDAHFRKRNFYRKHFSDLARQTPKGKLLFIFRNAINDDEPITYGWRYIDQNS